MASYDRKLLDGEHLAYLVGKIKTLIATKITNPSTKSEGQFLKYNGSEWIAANVPDTGVLTVDKATGETVVVVDNTDAANPKIGLTITSTQGNITLSKEADGLKANLANLGNSYTKNYTTAVTAGSTDLITSGAVQSAIAGLTGFHFEIVQALPTTGQTNVIYLVLKSSSSAGNVYTEYAWINNAWEQLGDTQIQLEYLNNGDIDTIWAL